MYRGNIEKLILQDELNYLVLPMSTFKAKLIDDESYYDKRKALLLINLFSLVVLGVLEQVYELNSMLGILYLLGAGLSLAYLVKLQRDMEQQVGNYRLEFDASGLRLLDKSGEVVEQYPIEDVERLKLDHSYQTVTDESLKDMFKTLKGQPARNRIVVHHKDGRRCFEFLIDTHYMVVQLKKVVDDLRQGRPTLLRS